MNIQSIDRRANVSTSDDALQRISQIENELDRRLDKLDDLRTQTDYEEATVLCLIHKQRLLEENVNLKN